MGKKEDLYCNVCGERIKIIKTKNEEMNITEDYLLVRKEWNYFSDMDESIFEFIMCSKCFRELMENFKIPAVSVQRSEIL